MAAPTVVFAKATTSIPPGGGLQTLFPATAGDLVVVGYLGLVTTGTVTAPTLSASAMTSHGGDVNSGTGDGRVAMWSKVLTPSDIVAGQASITYDDPGYSSHRMVWAILRHANGWDANREHSVYTDVAGFSTTQTLNGAGAPSRANLTVILWAHPTASGGLTFAWDGGTARAPFWDESTATDTTYDHSHHYGTDLGRTQADWNEYDIGSGATSFALNAGGSSAHAVVAVTFVVAPPAPLFISGKMNAAASMKGDLSVGHVLSGKLPAAASMKGTVRTGTPILVSGKLSAAASMRGRLPVVHLRAQPMNAAANLRGFIRVNPRPISGKTNAVADMGGTITFANPISGKLNAAASMKGTIHPGAPNPISGKLNAAASMRGVIGAAAPRVISGTTNAAAKMHGSILADTVVIIRDVTVTAGPPRTRWSVASNRTHFTASEVKV